MYKRHVIPLSSTTKPSQPAGPVIATSTTDPKKASATLQPPSAPHLTLGPRVSSYRARLSKFDHLDANGHELEDAAAIVTLDRARFHGHAGDPEDGAETTFADPASLDRLYKLVARSLDDPTRRAIIDTQPLIEVTVYESGLEIRVVPE